MENARDDDHQQCTNCKCWRIQDDFIGKRGGIVKTCIKCRDKDARQKSKDDVKAKRNERSRKMKYHITWRQKQREQNEEEFLAHNARIAKAWREQNKEHVAKWSRNNVNIRISSIAQQARVKGIPWSDDMTNDITEVMVKSQCFYCNINVSDGLHGIDRMDNTKGYCQDNCVPCCKKCNFMKKALDAHTFISRCQHISKIHNGEGQMCFDKWKPASCVAYEAYKARAIKKELEFCISKDDFNKITTEACVYCGIHADDKRKNGVDRKDNSIGYKLDNVVSCCSECNQMKCKMTSADFIVQCKMVAEHTCKNQPRLPDMIPCLKTITKRKWEKQKNTPAPNINTFES